MYLVITAVVMAWQLSHYPPVTTWPPSASGRLVENSVGF